MSQTMSNVFAQLCADHAAAGLAAYLDGLNVRYRVEREHRPADFAINCVEVTFTVPDVPKVIAIPELLGLYINPSIEALGLRILEDLETCTSPMVLTFESTRSWGIYSDSLAGPITVRARVHSSSWIDNNILARTVTVELAYMVVPA